MGTRPFLFEVVAVTPNGVTLVGIHPLVVDPASVSVSRDSRTSITEVVGGAIETVGGRTPYTYSLTGDHGVTARFIGPYGGPGPIRAQRFIDEVVNLSDATTSAAVAACMGKVSTSLGLPLILSPLMPMVDRGKCLFAINFYDLFTGESFACRITGYSYERSSRTGGFVGNEKYRLTLKETGPRREVPIVSNLIAGVVDGLVAWRQVNAYASMDALATLESITTGPAAPFAEQMAMSLTALSGQAQAASAVLVGGASLRDIAATRARLAGFPGVLQPMRMAAVQAKDALTRQPNELDPGRGWVDFSTADDDLVRYEQRITVNQIIEWVDFQSVAGAFFGLSQADYLTVIGAGADVQMLGPSSSGVDWTMTDVDDAASVEARFGVSWSEVLAANRLTPAEALRPGRKLRIPVAAPPGPQGIAGLPTYGSHIGREAWGRDIDLDFEVGPDGDVSTVNDIDVLQQGMTFLIEVASERLLSDGNVLPDAVRVPYVRERLRAVLLTDPRVAALPALEVRQASQSIDATVTIQAINGESVSVGG